MTNLSSLPLGFIEQLTPLLGDQLPDFLHSYSQPPLRGIRMRPGLTPPDDAEDPVPWAENAWYLPAESDAGAVPAHDAGAYYLQEPSAMAAAAALHPLPGDRVLDLCAAPGGKSTQLGAYLQGRGVLVCNEPVPSRAAVLSRNIERMGIPNAAVTCALPEDLSPRWAGYFDRVLVDAPCSGEGMFRRHPETRQEWTTASPEGCAQRQSHILRHAALMLRPGGMLAYSTCTFNPTENEGVIQRFLQEQPAFSLVPFSLPGLPENDGMLHLWPHQIRGEGHFLALMQKTGGETGKRQPSWMPPLPGKTERALAEDFLQTHIVPPLSVNGIFSGRLVRVPEDLPPLDRIRVLRLGLQLGEIKGKVFVPDHALALACKPLRAFPVTAEQARAYQQGEVLQAPDSLKGFCAVTLNGLSLGWGKASDGQLKNHYPKGLRRERKDKP